MTPASLIGQRIGNYVITSLLQEGGMGTVYIAEHPEIGRRVAIKIISPAHGQAAGIAERFLAEARALTRIEHANIVQIYDFGRTEAGQLYYIMELLKGRELATVMVEHGRMTPAEALPYLQQICSALHAAHQSNVVHRDLKPENIFVLDRPSIEIKLLDFGLAKLLGREGSQKSLHLTATGMVMGTPYTIAPEQAAGRPALIGPQTDIYSLGIIIYWLLIGYPPFTAEATPLVLAQHIKEQPRPIRDIDPTIPAEIAIVIDRCLEKQPKHRPASALDVSQAFARGVATNVAVAATQAVAVPWGGEPPSVAPGLPQRSPQVTGPSPMRRAGHRAGSSGMPKGREAPAEESVPALAGEDRVTTLRSSVGEVVTAAVRRRRNRQWPWVAAAGVASLGAIALVLVVTGGGDRKSRPDPRKSPSSAVRPQPGPAAQSRPPTTRDTDASVSTQGARAERNSDAAVSPSVDSSSVRQESASLPDSSPSAQRPRTRQVVVTADDLASQCRVRIDGVDVGVQRVPCYLQVSLGQKVEIEVTRTGFRSFQRAWTVNKDEVISLTVSGTDRRIVWSGHRAEQGAGDTAAGRPSPTRSQSPKTPTRSRRNASKVNKRRSTAPKRDDGEKPSEPLGSGTAPF